MDCQGTRKAALEDRKIGLILLGPPFHVPRGDIAPFIQEKTNVNIAIWPVVASNSASE